MTLQVILCSLNNLRKVIFINDPSFSFVYAKNLYYFDNFDNNLKIYNLEKNSFYSNYLNLSELGNLVDATLCENYIFAIFNKNNSFSVQKIKLNIENLSISNITQEIDFESTNFIKIHTIFFNDN